MLRLHVSVLFSSSFVSFLLAAVSLFLSIVPLVFFCIFLTSFLSTASQLTLFKLLRLITAKLQICGVETKMLLNLK